MIIKSGNSTKRPIKIVEETDSEINNYGQSIYRSLSDRASLLSLKNGYIMSPSPQQVYHNKFVTQNLQISFENTKVIWNGVVDLRKLKAPLRDLITLQKASIEVYPDESIKPTQGNELNRKCLATFGNLQHINHKQLAKICLLNGLELVKIDDQIKQFTVEIPHFTVYKFNKASESQEELENQEIENQQNIRRYELKDSSSSTSEEHTNYFQEPYEVSVEFTLEQQFYQMLKMEETDKNILQFVLDKYNPFKRQRVLALYLILFKKQFCGFQIVDLKKDQAQKKQKNPENNAEVISSIQSRQPSEILLQTQLKPRKIRIRKRQALMRESQKQGYLKNWLQWITNTYKDSLKTYNEIFRGLAFRNYDHLVLEFLYQDRLEDAQFLASIQDQFYRIQQQYPKNICQQLQEIALRDISSFEKEHWIFQLAICLWYHRIDGSEEKEALSQILSVKSNYGPDLSIEKHLLKIYFQIPPEKQELTVVFPFDECQDKNRSLVWWWMISNKINELEQQYYIQNGKSKQQYALYRQKIVRKLIDIYQNQKITGQILKRQEYLSLASKKIIALQFSKGNKETLKLFEENFHILNKKDVNEVYGLEMFAQGNFIQALRLFSESSFTQKNKESLLQRIVIILKSEEIISSYHLPTCRRMIESLKTILKHVNVFVDDLIKNEDEEEQQQQQIEEAQKIDLEENQQNTNIQILQNCFIFLEVKLEYKKMTWKIFKILFQFVELYFRENIAVYNKILDCCFDRLMKSPATPSLIKNNIKVYEELLDIFHSEKSKVLELKLMKISQ